MSLDLSELERLGGTSTPDTQEVVGDGRVEIKSHVLVFEVSLFGGVSKLSGIRILISWFNLVLIISLRLFYVLKVLKIMAN